jgi:hypothetical protein
MKNESSIKFPRQIIILALSLLVIIYSFSFFIKLYKNISFITTHLPFQEPGYQFKSFEKYLSGVHEIGFLTDKTMSPEDNDGIFLQAQYALAPTILDLDNTDQHIFLIDCRNFITAFDIMQHLKAGPIYVNEYTKVLAEKQ